MKRQTLVLKVEHFLSLPIMRGAQMRMVSEQIEYLGRERSFSSFSAQEDKDHLRVL